MFSINTNMQALTAYRYLTLNTAAANRAAQRISSGYRINSAADDAAGLTVSEGLRAQIGGLGQALRNSQNGISILQIADGALGQSSSILQQMLTLARQAANSGSQSSANLSAIQNQLQQLESALTDVANDTTYNGMKLLDGSFAGKQFQVGPNVGDTTVITIAGATAAQLGVGTLDVTGPAAGSMTASQGSTPNSTSTVTTTISSPSFGAGGSSWSNLSGTIAMNGLSLDLGSVTSSSGATPGLSDLNAALAATFGTNSSGAAYVTASVQSNSGQLVITGPPKTQGQPAPSLTFTQQSGAEAAIKAINNALSTVTSSRSIVGGTQNRFTAHMSFLNKAIENVTSADSVIRDADIALEKSNLVRAQMLQQADMAMLAQANRFQQTLLDLLLD